MVMSIVSAYFPPNCRLNSDEVGDELGNPIMVFGDFNAHSQSWGCKTDDTRAWIVQIMLDKLALVHLNDGSHTRIAAPPTSCSSAVDLTLCSKGLALDRTWSVLDDPAGSDHLPIVGSLGSFQIPLISNLTTPILIFLTKRGTCPGLTLKKGFWKHWMRRRSF
jgi:hypothetical protein